MKKLLPLLCLIILIMSACQGQLPSIEIGGGADTLDATQLNETAEYQSTEDALQTLTAQPPTFTLVPSRTWTPTAVVTLDRTRPADGTPTEDENCNQAGAGNPIDITIPDDTILAPGEAFVKTWRLENIGACTWTRLYALVFFSGNGMGAQQTHYLPAEVPPGGVIDLSVDMEAPMTAGIYQSNWMLADADGNLFGLGPNGDAPFWVRIKVVSDVTDTPQPTATPTSTPVVYLSSEVALADQNQLDLDTGELADEETANNDLVYLFGGDPIHVLMALNGTQWMVFGEEVPSFEACSQAEMSGNAVSFDEVLEGTYLCYRTSDGLPGRLLIVGFDAEAEQLQISFLTWAIP